jgi:kinesin family member C2/C3
MHALPCWLSPTFSAPYRNCKLTRLLSDSLGGKSKTLLVVNLSPTRESAAESRCSCEFASRAKKVELGRAIRNVDAAIEKGALPVRPSSMGASNRVRRSLNMPELNRTRGSR